jgi:hypothetical protein
LSGQSGRLTASLSQLAAYVYDSTASGNCGKGLRTGMPDSPGTSSYKFDTRGRLLKEDLVIDSVTYTTEFTCDSADWVTTFSYRCQSYDFGLRQGSETTVYIVETWNDWADLNSLLTEKVVPALPLHSELLRRLFDPQRDTVRIVAGA